jgi:H+/Cl- antiporter ClcA
MLGGAISIGLVAILFAKLADQSSALFGQIEARWRWLPLLITPLGFALMVWITNRYAPAARGSGIPQVIAARENPEAGAHALLTLPIVLVKAVLTFGALMVGASTGREGPTVQLAAAVLVAWHNVLRVPVRASVLIAGGAAGVAAAFNTPLAGIAFAIEELAGAYEQRTAMLVMTAILISGAVALGLAGDYVYFGSVGASMTIREAIFVAPVAGILGGLAGGLFARLTLGVARRSLHVLVPIQRKPVVFAALCGLIVAVIGCTTRLTWGAGYPAAHAMIVGVHAPLWFGLAKFTTTLATAVAGLPGGIFAPSLSTGAGFGNMLRWLFPGEPASAVVLLGMVAYFTGVVRAPLTAVFILTETTNSRGLMLPLMATAIVADVVSRLVCETKLYEGLSETFLSHDKASASPEPPACPDSGVAPPA